MLLAAPVGRERQVTPSTERPERRALSPHRRARRRMVETLDSPRHPAVVPPNLNGERPLADRRTEFLDREILRDAAFEAQPL